MLLRFCRRLLLFFLIRCHYLRTTRIVVIHYLAMQTLDTFVRMDIAFWCNGLYRTFMCTNLTRVATHFVAT